ncbi:MAG: hypothetical protein Q9159_005587 [Coniocarpon cinnabarinum]
MHHLKPSSSIVLPDHLRHPVVSSEECSIEALAMGILEVRSFLDDLDRAFDHEFPRPSYRVAGFSSHTDGTMQARHQLVLFVRRLSGGQYKRYTSLDDDLRSPEVVPEVLSLRRLISSVPSVFTALLEHDRSQAVRPTSPAWQRVAGYSLRTRVLRREVILFIRRETGEGLDFIHVDLSFGDFQRLRTAIRHAQQQHEQWLQLNMEHARHRHEQRHADGPTVAASHANLDPPVHQGRLQNGRTMPPPGDNVGEQNGHEPHAQHGRGPFQDAS